MGSFRESTVSAALGIIIALPIGLFLIIGHYQIFQYTKYSPLGVGYDFWMVDLFVTLTNESNGKRKKCEAINPDGEPRTL